MSKEKEVNCHTRSIIHKNHNCVDFLYTYRDISMLIKSFLIGILGKKFEELISSQRSTLRDSDCGDYCFALENCLRRVG